MTYVAQALLSLEPCHVQNMSDTRVMCIFKNLSNVHVSSMLLGPCNIDDDPNMEALMDIRENSLIIFTGAIVHIV